MSKFVDFFRDVALSIKLFANHAKYRNAYRLMYDIEALRHQLIEMEENTNYPNFTDQQQDKYETIQDQLEQLEHDLYFLGIGY